MSITNAPLGVCAIGASAGGLEPLSDLIDRMPTSLGVAFVVAQHLSPDHESVMVKLLERRTSMQVQQLADGQQLLPNNVYVLGPGQVATVNGSTVAVEARAQSGAEAHLHRPIDALFLSLATWGARSVAIVLSGSGSDGTDGIVAVRAAGGLTLAQDQTAQFGDMPDAAGRSGSVDATGTTEDLAEFVAQFFSTGVRPVTDLDVDPAEAEILVELETSTGVNFDDYKRATVSRRLDHRMRAVGLDSLRGLLERVRADPTEPQALAQDILIGVTSFFRDQEVFNHLSREVLPGLVRTAAKEGYPLRCWSVGCATGQEAYSLAMAITEARETIAPTLPVKIFASDVHDGALAIANEGLYPENDMEHLDPERRERFFRREAEGWRVKPELRGMVAFSHQNVLTQPPFTRIDLVSCRNAMIYFTPPAQRDALWAFGFALRTDGVLMLGKSESLGPAADDYEPIGSGMHRMTSNRISMNLRRGRRIPDALAPYRSRPFVVDRAESQQAKAQTGPFPFVNDAYETILAAQRVGALQVDSSNRLVQIFGVAATWLEFPVGLPPDDVTRLIEDIALRAAVGSVLRQLKADVEAPSEIVSVDLGDGPGLALLEGARVNNGGSENFIVHCRPASADHFDAAPDERDEGVADGGDDRTAVLLDQELRNTRAQLESVKVQLEESVRQQETSEQQLTATNEELLVSNEELQTSIEELSSTNEELRTVADENELRLRDVLLLRADLEHVLDATDIGILLLGPDLTIRRFSGTCDQYFSLIDSDVGRPFAHIRANFHDEELRTAVQHAASSGKSTVLRTDSVADFSRTLLINVLPYELLDDRSGVSLALVDITGAQAREQELEQLSERLTETLESAGVVLWERSADMEPIWASKNFEEVVGFSIEDWRQFPNIDSIHPDDIETLTGYLGDQAAAIRAGESAPPTDLDMRVSNDDGSYRVIRAQSRTAYTADGPFVRGINTDVTELRRRESELTMLNRELTDYTNLASHDLRAPLRAIRGLISVLKEDHAEMLTDTAIELTDKIDGRAKLMGDLLDDLLNYARSGALDHTDELVEFPAMVDEIIEAVGSYEGITIVPQVDIEAVETEKVLLTTCIRNLVDNAAKHHPGPSGKVTIRAQSTRHMLIVTVSDDGPGIDPAHHEAVFRPFQRIGGAGSGIGLAAVRKIVTGRGGTVELRSEIGRGSAFTLTWPLTSPQRSATGATIIESAESTA